MKFGVHAGLWMARWTDDLDPIVRTAADLGFDGIEVSLLGMTTEKAEALRRTTIAHGLAVTCTTGLSRAADTGSVDASVRDEGLSYMRWAVATSAGLGATMLSGVIYAPWGLFAPEDKPGRTLRSIAALRMLAKDLDRHDIRLGLEAINRFETDMINTAAEARAMADATECERIGVLLDSFHLNIEERDIAAAIQSTGAKLFHFHVSDNDRSVPGSGHCPWNDVVAGLRGVGYDGWIVAEMFVKAGNPSSTDLNIWRDLAPDPTLAARQALSFMRETFR